MPAHPLAVPRQLAEEVAVAADHRLAKHVGGEGHQLRMGDDVPHAAAGLVPVGDFVAAPAGGEGTGQKAVEIAADRADLGLVEDIERKQVPTFVVGVDLGPRQDLRFLHAEREEAKVPTEVRIGVPSRRRVQPLSSPSSLSDFGAEIFVTC